MKKVIVDLLGGDNCPDAAVEGALAALKKDANIELVLVGDEAFKARFTGFENRVEFIHTTESISCHEQPTVAIRQKANSSIVLGQTALRHREDCGAFISSGSTGAVLTGAFMKVGRLEGVSRPALCPTIPTKDGRGVMLIDCGANMDCKPVNLVHFALMANVYMKAKGVANPRVALVNVGTENEKGNELTHATFELLKKCEGLNFVGNMEARDASSGNYDILVCDGFVGNVLLKTLEGTASLISGKLKEVLRGFSGLVGKVFLGKRLINMKRGLSEDAAGGAVLLGIKKPVFKVHGNAKAKVFCNAILYASNTAQLDLGEQIKDALAVFNSTNGETE